MAGMRLTGVIVWLIGAVLIAIYIAVWANLTAEHGVPDAVRIGFIVWPGNVMGIAILGLIVSCVVAGWYMLFSADTPK
jgi:hypothetical protein